MIRLAQPLVLGAVILLGCTALSAAHAAVTVTTSFTNFQITIVDLDLNDGIAAGFSSEWEDNGSSRLVTAAIDTPVGPDAPPQSIVGEELRLESRDLQYHSLSRNGVVVSELTSGPGFLVLGRSITTGNTTSVTSFQTRAFLFEKNVRIEPNTNLILTADVEMSAGASTIFRLSVEPGLDGSEYFYERDAGAGGLDEQMRLSFSSGAEAALGFMSLIVQAEGGLLPIPEPQTYATMLAGLAMLLAVGRRRLRDSPRSGER